SSARRAHLRATWRWHAARPRASSPSRRLQTDEHGRRTATLLRQPEVFGNEPHVVWPLEPRVRHAEEVQQRLAIAHHGVAGLAGLLVPLALEQADHVKDRYAAVYRDATQRIDRGIEAGVLNHQCEGLTAHPEPSGDGVGLVLGRAG